MKKIHEQVSSLRGNISTLTEHSTVSSQTQSGISLHTNTLVNDTISLPYLRYSLLSTI